jgi:hypothetical protein
LADRDEQETQREYAFLAKTQILAAKAQEMWDLLVPKLERQCTKFNGIRHNKEFLFENISRFQVRISLPARPRSVDIVFTPALNKWAACDGRGDSRTFEVRLSVKGTPTLYEVSESPDSDEPQYAPRSIRQALEEIVEMVVGAKRD